MSSVQSEEECPQCGGSMLCDYYYGTGEEYLICSCCGKYESWTLARNSRGKIILKKNGKAKYKHIKHRGYGVATIATNNGVKSCHLFRKPIRKKDIRNFMRTLDDENVIKDACCLVKWDNKNKTIVPIYGKMPESDIF